MISSRTLVAIAGAGAFIVWLLYATGGLVYLYAVSQVFFATSRMEREIREIDALGRANPKFARGLDVQGADDGDRKKAGYVALSYGDKLHENRSVSVQTSVRLDDLLDAGETLPEPTLLKAFVQARAARLGDGECKLLEQALASRCVVRMSNGEPDTRGLARISMTLGFVQKSPFGALPSGPRAAYVETDEAIGGQRPVRNSLSGLPDARARAYAEIAALCDKLRVSQGNCAITRVMVAASPDPTGSAAEFSARATLSSLMALDG
jgi:hypothetical protein